MQLHGERTRLACRRCRLDHDFKTPTFLSLFGVERMVVGSIRRDAEYHTPEAYAPHSHCLDSGKNSRPERDLRQKLLSWIGSLLGAGSWTVFGDRSGSGSYPGSGGAARVPGLSGHRGHQLLVSRFNYGVILNVPMPKRGRLTSNWIFPALSFVAGISRSTSSFKLTHSIFVTVPR